MKIRMSIWNIEHNNCHPVTLEGDLMALARIRDLRGVVQNYYNTYAQFDYMGLDCAVDLDNVGGVIALRDRVLFYIEPGFVDLMEGLVDDGLYSRWDIVQNHDLDPSDDWCTARFGYRETVLRISNQIVIHTTMDGDPTMAESDFDLFNPERGLAGLIPHGVEFAWNKITGAKTNPFKVARELYKRGRAVNFVRDEDIRWAENKHGGAYGG